MTKDEIITKAQTLKDAYTKRRINSDWEISGTLLTPAEAAADSLLKWYGVVSSRLTLDEGQQLCGLCELYWGCVRGGGCPGCPLEAAGFGCLTTDSVWEQFDRAVSCKDLTNAKQLAVRMYDQVYEVCSKIIVDHEETK